MLALKSWCCWAKASRTWSRSPKGACYSGCCMAANANSRPLSGPATPENRKGFFHLKTLYLVFRFVMAIQGIRPWTGKVHLKRQKQSRLIMSHQPLADAQKKKLSSTDLWGSLRPWRPLWFILEIYRFKPTNGRLNPCSASDCKAPLRRPRDGGGPSALCGGYVGSSHGRPQKTIRGEQWP